MIKLTKNYIRQKLLKMLKNQKEVKRLKKSFLIYKKLFSLPEFIKAKLILFYYSFDGEVETSKMIDRAISLGKKVMVPVIDRRNTNITPSLISDCGHNLEAGPYGIYQPKQQCIRKAPLEKIDLIIVPAVAFDLKGNRIGRGAGYYDRFLSALPKRILTIGLAFDFQIIPQSPSLEAHDFPVDKVLYA